ncbi:MAG TPA: hypothetical protein PL181_14760 [bacterium]|nr:hypothetical protein [bacterium]
MADTSQIRRYGPMLALAITVLAAGYWRTVGDTVDDAWITFRCVDHLVHGAGLSFNPVPRVECFSNPLLVALLPPAAAAGIPLALAARVLGAAAFLLCILGVFRVARRAGASPLFSAAAACATAASFPLLYYAVTGLETGIFAALLLGGIWRYGRRGRLDLTGVLIWLAAAWCRPEGPAYAAVFFLLVLWRERHALRPALLLTATAAALFGAGLLLRHAYYGLWLPNTFYAKPPGTADLDPGSGALRAALLYLGRYLLDSGWIPPLLAAWSALLALGAARRRRTVETPLLLAAVVGTGAAFALYTGGDWFPAGRYLQPVTPALLVLAALGAQDLAGRFQRAAPPRLFAALIVLPVAAASLLTLREFHHARSRYPFHVMNSSELVAAGRWMRDNLPPETSIAAYRIGAVGYFSGCEIIDLFGLADHTIATLIARHPDYHPGRALGDDLPELRALLAARRPGAVLQISLQGSSRPPERQLYGLRYIFRKAWTLGLDQELLLYLRADLTSGSARQQAQSSPD